jgi:hypothetical protein
LHHRPPSAPPSELLVILRTLLRLLLPADGRSRCRRVVSLQAHASWGVACRLSPPAACLGAGGRACLLACSRLLSRVANGASRRQRRSSGPRPPVAHAVPLLGRLATLLEALSKKRGATNKGPTPGPARKRAMLANLKRCLQVNRPRLLLGARHI